MRSVKTGANKKYWGFIHWWWQHKAITLVIKIWLCKVWFFSKVLNYFITHFSGANSSPSGHHRLTWQIFELCFQILIACPFPEIINILIYIQFCQFYLLAQCDEAHYYYTCAAQIVTQKPAIPCWQTKALSYNLAMSSPLCLRINFVFQ